MRRLAISLFVLALLGSVWRFGPLSTEAQSGTAPVVGVWQVTLTLPGVPPVRTLSTYTSDGFVFITAPVSRPAIPGGSATVWYTTTAHGVWQDAGNGQITVAASNTVTSEMGLPVGFQTIRATVSVGDDGMLSGETTSTLTDPTGAELQSTTGTLVGQRIVVEAMAAATPSS